MSGEKRNIFARGEEFLTLFKKGADFTQELLRENERLRLDLMEIQEAQESAAQNPEDWEKLRQELLGRIQNLQQEYENVRQRLHQVEEENKYFAERYIEVEEENNNLANLYVASYQLHSTLSLDEVLKIIIEIVINLVGAEVFAVYLMEERRGEMQVAAAEGARREDFPPCTVGSGVIGKALESTEPTCWQTDRSEDFSSPIVLIPLSVQSRPIGAIAIYGLLQQKEGFSALDHELFAVLGGHAATALFAAKLYSQSERKLNTIQGFIDLLTK